MIALIFLTIVTNGSKKTIQSCVFKRMEKITKEDLRDLILSGATAEFLLDKCDYSDITDMSELFCETDIETIPHIDTSNVTNMEKMFWSFRS